MKIKHDKFLSLGLMGLCALMSYISKSEISLVVGSSFLAGTVSAKNDIIEFDKKTSLTAMGTAGIMSLISLSPIPIIAGGSLIVGNLIENNLKKASKKLKI